MNNNILSQEEIDALVGNNKESIGSENIKKNHYLEEELSPTEIDIIGEIGNIAMSTAATTLSSLINKRVLITTPKVSLLSFENIIKECKIPKLVANIAFKNGLNGQNLLMMDFADGKVIADLMMGGDGTNLNSKFSNIELSAVAEAMNQMIGSASTSLATMLKKSIDIYPPEIVLWDEDKVINFKKIDLKEKVIKIAFSLTVEDLIESEIMQIFSYETVNEMIDLVAGDNKYINSENINMREESNFNKLNKIEDDEKQVEIKKPVFNELSPTSENVSKPKNLDIIMDVPLELSVVLGKTKKSIKEVLSFNNGSIIELNKLADEPLEIYVNGRLIAQGEVVVINENFGVRITNILAKEERVQSL